MNTTKTTTTALQRKKTGDGHGGRTVGGRRRPVTRQALTSILDPQGSGETTNRPGSPSPTQAGPPTGPPAIGRADCARPVGGRISASSFEKTRARRLCDFTQVPSELSMSPIRWCAHCPASSSGGHGVRPREAHAAACSESTTSRTGMNGVARRVRKQA